MGDEYVSVLTAHTPKLFILSCRMLFTIAWELGASGTSRGSLVFHGPRGENPLVGVSSADIRRCPPARAAPGIARLLTVTTHTAASTEHIYRAPLGMTVEPPTCASRVVQGQRRYRPLPRASGTAPGDSPPKPWVTATTTLGQRDNPAR